MRGAGIGQIRVARIPRAGPWLQTRGQERVREHAWLRQESLSSPDINLIQVAGSMRRRVGLNTMVGHSSHPEPSRVGAVLYTV